MRVMSPPGTTAPLRDRKAAYMNKLPWHKPQSNRDADGPLKKGPTVFEVGGVEFFIRQSDHQVQGIHKGREIEGRPLYRIACVECDCLLHGDTTSPSRHVRGHLIESHSFKGELEYISSRKVN